MFFYFVILNKAINFIESLLAVGKPFIILLVQTPAYSKESFWRICIALVITFSLFPISHFLNTTWERNYKTHMKLIGVWNFLHADFRSITNSVLSVLVWNIYRNTWISLNSPPPVGFIESVFEHKLLKHKNLIALLLPLAIAIISSFWKLLGGI